MELLSEAIGKKVDRAIDEIKDVYEKRGRIKNNREIAPKLSDNGMLLMKLLN